MLRMNVETKITKKMIKEVVEKNVSKSQKIQELFTQGLDLKEISTLLNIRYNFSYNVYKNLILKGVINENDVIKEQKDSKKDQIIKLYNENKTLTEICKELKINYNYTWKIINEYKNNS